jgi:hypothetical protein
MLLFNILKYLYTNLQIMINTNLLKRFIAFAIIIATIATSCKRTEIPITPDPTPTNPVGGPVNDAAQVMASVSGIVLDESNVPVSNAVVTSGTATTTTNSNGMFIFQNISLSKENGSITAVKAGYFKGVRSFKTTEGKNHSVRLQLMQRVLSSTVNAAAGGTINSNGGASIVFPAGAFVTSTGAAYTGVVSVYSRWIDPTAANLPFVIPGDLRGLNTTGVENILETYGMVGAELTDASGNVLKIAPGKTATVSFPIPPSLSATAPATIILWHFDDATARWKENGTASKTGSNYIAQVDKFSFWNVDVPSTNFINLDYTLINATTNTPLVSTSTRIKRTNGTYGYGITNNAGFVSGLVPKNEALVLEVIANNGCTNVLFSQNIGPFASNISLGNTNILINAAQTITFTGILNNCSGGAVTNGYVSLAATGGNGGFGNTNATGAFSFTFINCTASSMSYNYQGTDNATAQQTSLLSGTGTSGTVNLGTLAACGVATTADVYVAGTENGIAKVWKNGLATNLSILTDSAEAYSVFVSGTDVYVAGEKNRKATVWKNGVATILTTGTNIVGYANSVFVSGIDVYVVGTEKNFIGIYTSAAKVWKNGVATNLAVGSFTDLEAKSVFVAGSDVYVAGGIFDLSNEGKSVVWKNAVPTILTNSNDVGAAASVYIFGSDVYVGGYLNGDAAIWKNGITINLPSNTFYSDVTSVFVVGSDVYASGYGQDSTGTFTTAKMWKNGIETTLSSGNTETYANSIFVKSTDVYTLLNTINTVTNPFTFSSNVIKNGLSTNFFNATNSVAAYSIFVK